MFKQNGNMRIKIFRSIFAAVNLALISGGLISCAVKVPQPLAPTEQQKPVLQPNQNDQDDEDGDRKNRNNDDEDGDRKNPNNNDEDGDRKNRKDDDEDGDRKNRKDDDEDGDRKNRNNDDDDND
jgi:hypothetical protein